MRLHRVFLPQPLAGVETVNTDGATAHYLTRVLRLRAGASLVLFDGNGGEYRAELQKAGRDAARLMITEFMPQERESRLRICLAQGIARGERMDQVVQKATELGVSAIVPLLTDHTVVRLDDERSRRRHEHWKKVSISACEQSGRNRLPQVSAPTHVDEWLGGSMDDSSLRLLLQPTAAHGISRFSETPDSVTLLIGPEGGLSEREQDVALARGFQSVRLGPRILRTETAALAAIAVLQSVWGDAG